MTSTADIASYRGTRDIRFDPEILANVYQSKNLKEWGAHLKTKPKGTTLAGGNEMDRWVISHIDFLTAAIGQPGS